MLFKKNYVESNENIGLWLPKTLLVKTESLNQLGNKCLNDFLPAFSTRKKKKKSYHLLHV